MSTEQTPLLEEQPNRNAVYDRFSRSRKNIIVAIVSWIAQFEIVLVAGSFIPSIPDIARELHSEPTIISLTVSLTIFATAIGSVTCAANSTFYGRRPVYLFSLPFLSIGSLGVVLSRSVPELMVWRFIQTFGASGGLSVGSGVIGDIYKLDERGTAMGVFFAAVLLGPALAPLAGGLAAEYSSWRAMQCALLASGVIAFLAVFFGLPETSHPKSRGIDRLYDAQHPEWRKSRLSLMNFTWVNPLASLSLLRSPNLMAVSLAGTTVLFANYTMLVPIAYTIGERYNISNEAMIGACFLPSGLGNIVGAPLAGRISDHNIQKWRKNRGDKWVPEDRLRGTLFAAAVLVPLSVLAIGVITQYVEGRLGLTLNLVFLFFNGFGLDMVLGPLASYAVDIFHSRSAESMAANTGFRSLVLALATTLILPSINHIGVLYTNVIAAGVVWIGFGLLWVTIRFGDRMRAWVDVGYSTDQDN